MSGNTGHGDGMETVRGVILKYVLTLTLKQEDHRLEEGKGDEMHESVL